MMKDIHIFEPGPTSWGVGCIICKEPAYHEIHQVGLRLNKIETIEEFRRVIKDLKMLNFTDKQIIELTEFNLNG